MRVTKGSVVRWNGRTGLVEETNPLSTRVRFFEVGPRGKAERGTVLMAWGEERLYLRPSNSAVPTEELEVLSHVTDAALEPQRRFHY